MHKESMRRYGGAGTLFACSLLLAACGGGSEPATSPAQNVVLQGTAATGRAIAAATVQAKCATGNGSATTGADGTFTLTITAGSLPCALQVSAGGQTLHAVAEGSGTGTSIANLTPLSELIVGRLAGGDAAALFATFDAAAQANVSAAALLQARGEVKLALAGVLDLGTIDPLKDELVAATSDGAGNSLDLKLDALQAALDAAGLSFAELKAMVIGESSSVAAALVGAQMQPAAAHCAALKSGTYRFIDTGASGAARMQKVAIDAQQMTLTFPSGIVLRPVATDTDCRFSTPGGSMDIAVARSGIVVARYVDDSAVGRLAFAFPEQTLPMSEMAGIWNWLSFEKGADATTYTARHGESTVDADGTVSASDSCSWTACAARPGSSFAPADGGGFTATRDGEVSSHAFLCRTPDGTKVRFTVIANGGGYAVSIPRAAVQLPLVGATTNSWNFFADPQGVASLDDASNTVLSVDSVARTYMRRNLNTSIDSFIIDTPRVGMRHRSAGSSPLEDGATWNYAEMVSLPGPGVGFYILGNGQIGAAVVKP